MTNLSKLRAALLGSGAMLALAAGPAFAGETDDLKAQIDALQARLDQLEKQQASTEAKQVAAPADAVVGGDYPGSFKLPGSDTSYSIHGFTKLDLIMDLDQSPVTQAFFRATKLEPDNAPAGNQGFRTKLFAQQSRFIIQSRTPTDYGQLLTFLAGDFFGKLGGTDSVLPDNTGGLRMREVWGQLGPIRAGFDDDLLSDFSFADIQRVSFGRPAGPEQAKRTPLIRYTHPYRKFVFAAELSAPGSTTPDSSVANGTGQMFLSNDKTLNGNDGKGASLQQLEVPNFSAAVHYIDTWGHVRAAGQLRYFRLNDGKGGDVGGTNHTLDDVTYVGELSWGLKLGYFLPSLGKDRLVGDANWGSGAANTQKAFDDKESITVLNFGKPGQRSFTNPVWGASGGVVHWWTNNLRSNVAYYFSKVHLSHDIAGIDPTQSAQTTDTQAFIGNLIWSPVKKVNFGLEYIYGEKHGLSDATGFTARGTDSRIQIGLMYLF